MMSEWENPEAVLDAVTRTGGGVTVTLHHPQAQAEHWQPVWENPEAVLNAVTLSVEGSIGALLETLVESLRHRLQWHIKVHGGTIHDAPRHLRRFLGIRGRHGRRSTSRERRIAQQRAMQHACRAYR